MTGRGVATRVTVAIIALWIGVSLVPARAQQTQGVVAVGVMPAQKKPITKTADFVGRVQAINRVEVRARVTGYLEAVLFTEGDMVKEGQELYQIEPEQFKAVVDQASGALQASQAKKLLTAVQYQRAEDLMKTSAGTVVNRDQALTADRSADAQIAIDQANLETAKINLGYTDITSPIAGKISRTNVTKGNVVGPDSGVLTTIVSQDPMYVLFPVSERDVMRAREEGRANGNNPSDIKVQIIFADGTTYNQVGKIDFVDVTVDKSTDTVQVRAVFANPQGLLIDGQLVRAKLAIGNPQEQVVVPQAALISDQQGTYVFIVEDGKAAIRRVKPGGVDGDNAIISEGLKGGELIVVEGLQSLRPGMAVQAQPIPAALKGS